jgi:hypothetical protein
MPGVEKGITMTEEATDPGGVMGLVTVTVWPVIHDLPVMDTPLLVNLPEDDSVLLRGTEAIATGRMKHLLPREITALDDRLTELTADRQAPPPEHPTRMPRLRLLHRLERRGKYLG